MRENVVLPEPLPPATPMISTDEVLGIKEATSKR
jgi:hypothetical protein